jgi:hypothetical protein
MPRCHPRPWFVELHHLHPWRYSPSSSPTGRGALYDYLYQMRGYPWIRLFRKHDGWPF